MDIYTCPLNYTLKEAFKENRIQSGYLLLFKDGTKILVGDATLFHAPSESDAGIGWGDFCDKVIDTIIKLDIPNVISYNKRSKNETLKI